MPLDSSAPEAGPGGPVLANPSPRGAGVRGVLRGALPWFAVAAGLAAGAGWGWHWWTVGRFVQSTDDAYVAADQVAAAPRVSGYVSAVLVGDNQEVAAGQPLVRIDPANSDAALARQRAAAEARAADVATAEAQLRQQRAAVAEASARLDGARADARFTAGEAERYRRLSRSGAETAESLAKAVNERDRAQAAVRSDEAALEAERRKVDTMAAQVAQAQAEATAAGAAVSEAGLDVGNTLIRSAVAGRVGDRTVRVGQFVQPGTRLLTVVPVRDAYVVANFKETQLARMRPGQRAGIRVDALGGETLHGTLESFAPGTGSQFALLPPENATGNFTKIVQRVPVRFRLDRHGCECGRLVPGLSVTVEVDTRGAADDRR